MNHRTKTDQIYLYRVVSACPWVAGLVPRMPDAMIINYPPTDGLLMTGDDLDLCK